MVQIDGLRAQVSARYDPLGLPSWPDPHPGVTSPAAEEYSRVSDPERYRIVHARASAWVETLGALPGIEVDRLAPAALDEGGRAGGVTQAVRLGSTRPATLPLLLVTRQVPLEDRGGAMTVLDVCAARTSVVLEMVPGCGCDACDSGSQSLLDVVDDTISGFVGGPSVMLRGPGWYADWRPGAGSSGGDGHGPGHARMMQLCRRLAAGADVPLPEGSEAHVGAAWFG